MTTITPIRNEADLSLAHKLANEDNHVLYHPTNLVVKDLSVIGAVSLGSVPRVDAWLDTKRANVRDTLQTWSCLVSLLAERQSRTCFVVPCTLDSPLHGVLKKLQGVRSLGVFEQFIVEE